MDKWFEDNLAPHGWLVKDRHPVESDRMRLAVWNIQSEISPTELQIELSFDIDPQDSPERYSTIWVTASDRRIVASTSLSRNREKYIEDFFNHLDAYRQELLKTR